jgi:FkbM family methyltransferase
MKLLGPLRGVVGRRLHGIIDRRVAEQLAAALPAAEQRAYDRVRWAALREPQVFGPPERLRISATAEVNDALFNTVSGTVTVGDHAIFGHGVAILTGTHDIEATGLVRRHAIPGSGRDVVVDEGAWIASRATVLGPARIGASAVVAAGALVTGDVPPGAVVAGVPARIVRQIGEPDPIPPAIDADTAAGAMYLHADDEVITPVLRAGAGAGDPELVALLAAVRPGMTVLDVGANIGFVTLLLARAVGSGGRVVSVEPHPANLHLLRANIARHGLEMVEVVEAAAWTDGGTVELSECAGNTGDHRVGALLEQRPTITVPAVRLDDVVRATDRVGVIKLDTQATEHLALRGARGIVERDRPLIFAEYWPDGIRVAGGDPRAVLQEYRSLGYTPTVVEEAALGDMPTDEAIVTAVDARPGPFGGFATLRLAADG